MEAIFKHVTEQYEAIQDSRHILLEYCKTISGQDLLTENKSFGRGGSIRNLLVHIVNVYEFWIAKNALNKEIVFTDYQSIQSISEIISLFEKVDIFMNEFIEQFRLDETRRIEFELNGNRNSSSLLKLFTHVITHEFHHKGQILSISRHFGYIPVDTDVIR
jgi:uncharacterized damage-inducible protein DinB